MAYLIGIDYGTDSARAVLTDDRGHIFASAVRNYPRWAERKYCDPGSHVFRQHPLDYLEVLEGTIREVVEACPDAGEIAAIAIDATSSTAGFVDCTLTPLALRKEYAEDPDAMFVVWKDHSTVTEAGEITALCRKQPHDYSAHCGYNYSSECLWSKALGIVRRRPDIRRDGWSMMELADFIPSVLVGCKEPSAMKFGRCSAVAKHMWGEEWGGFPPDSFLNSLDPALTALRHNMNDTNCYCDERAGYLCKDWAERLGLTGKVAVAVGNIDSYAGAMAAGVRKGTLAMNIGTTGCFITEIPSGTVRVPGVFGQVPGGIHRGMDLLEVGLAAFGDMFAWYRRTLGWFGGDSPEIMARLTEEAAALPLDGSAPIATDNFNGRRSPRPNDSIPASMMGLTINTTAPQMFRSLIEAAAYAARTVIGHLDSYGVRMDRLRAMGGVAQKSPLVMQTLADVLQMEVGVIDCKDTCALGDTLFAAVAGGVWPDLDTAAEHMCPGLLKTYVPDASTKEYYDGRYEKYLSLSNYTESCL